MDHRRNDNEVHEICGQSFAKVSRGKIPIHRLRIQIMTRPTRLNSLLGKWIKITVQDHAKELELHIKPRMCPRCSLKFKIQAFSFSRFSFLFGLFD